MQALISNNLLKSKSVKPRKKPYEIRDIRLPGFILRVQPSGYMAYVAEYGRGKRITIGPVSKLTPAQARDEAEKKLSAATLGDDPMVERKAKKAETLRQYLDEVYEPWMLSHHKRSGKRQVARIRSCFADLLDAKLPELTAWLIEKYRTKRLKADVSIRTVNRDVHALRAALRRAQEWDILQEHPLQKLKPIKEDSSPRVRYLTAKEETALRSALDAREERLRKERDSGNAWRKERGYPELPDLRAVAFADRLKPLTLLSLNTGIRQGEAFNLKWQDVDFTQATLTLAGEDAKTNQTRHIPLNGEGLQVLRDWKQQSASSDYVFPSDDGGRLNNVKRSWAAVLKGTKDPKILNFRWHDLRHTFASNLVMAGVDLNTVRELLGHSDIKMTLRYAHLAPEHKRAAVEKLTQRQVDTLPKPVKVKIEKSKVVSL